MGRRIQQDMLRGSLAEDTGDPTLTPVPETVNQGNVESFTNPRFQMAAAGAASMPWYGEANPDAGIQIDQARVRDTAARLWDNAYQMSNGDATFADVIGGIANGEAGFAGIKDNRGATGIFQMDPAGGWQQLDKYLKDNGIAMSRDEAAKNVDIMSDFYVTKLYKSYQRARAAGYTDPEELTVQTVIYQWDPVNERGAAHNAGIEKIPSLQKNYREGYHQFKQGVFRMVDPRKV
jgi:hypothetical protein